MLYTVLFEDNEGLGDEVRRRHMADHLAFLDRHAAAMIAAGPLLDDRGAPAGGLWLVKAENAAAVDALVRADPFWPTGLRKSVRVRAWRQVFADGRRLVDV